MTITLSRLAIPHCCGDGCYRAVAATRRFQCAMKASVLAGVAALAPLAKGARMPSTADEVCAETRNAALRAAADLRCGLDCLSVMPPMLRRRGSTGFKEATATGGRTLSRPGLDVLKIAPLVAKSAT